MVIIRVGDSPKQGGESQEMSFVHLFVIYLVNPYCALIESCSSRLKLIKYDFQPGQKLMCHRQILPNNEVGLSSCFFLKGQCEQLCSFMILMILRDCYVSFVNILLSIRYSCWATAHQLYKNHKYMIYFDSKLLISTACFITLYRSDHNRAGLFRHLFHEKFHWHLSDKS